MEIRSAQLQKSVYYNEDSMKMKKAFLFLIIINFVIAISGQAINLDSIFEPKLCGEIFRMKTGTLGEQFYNNDWTESDIKLTTGETAVNKLLKYNAFMDEVIWLQADGLRQVQLEKHFIDEVYLKNGKGGSVVFKRMLIKLPRMTDSDDIFVEVLSEKSASLYVFRNVVIQGTVDRIENGVLYSYDRLVSQPVYILSLPDKGTVTFQKIGRSALLKALPEAYKTTVIEIIQRNHLAVRNEDDLIKLVSLIN